MAADGISTLRAGKANAKGKRQQAKLLKAAAKRQGLTITTGLSGAASVGGSEAYGTWNHSGSTAMMVPGDVNVNGPGYRKNHWCKIYFLPSRYLTNVTGNIADLNDPAHANYDPNGYWSPNAFDLTGDKTILKDHGNASWGAPSRYARPWKIAPTGGDREHLGL